MLRNLKAEIIKNFGTQGDFAQVVESTDTIVSRVIRERHKLRREEKEKWATVLNSNPKDLFGN